MYRIIYSCCNSIMNINSNRTSVCLFKWRYHPKHFCLVKKWDAPLLSVIETCRLRDINPWNYIAKVLALARSPTFPCWSLIVRVSLAPIFP